MGTDVWFYKQSYYLYPSHIGIRYSELEVPNLWTSLLAECQWGWGSTCLSFSSAHSSQMCPLQHWRKALPPCLVDSFAKYITSPIPAIFVPMCLPVVSISWLAINIHRSGKEGEGVLRRSGASLSPEQERQGPGNGSGSEKRWKVTKMASLQPQLQQAASQIYGWHLAEQWCKPNVKSKYILIYLCLDLVLSFINDSRFD